MSAERSWTGRGGRFSLALSAVALVIAACAGQTPSAAAPSSASSPPTSAQPSSAPAPSVTASPVADFVLRGDRPVTVHVPDSYEANEPAPLLILLHGYSGSGREEDANFNLAPVANAHGLYALTPEFPIERRVRDFQ